jgi:hypothetical protein
MIIEAILRINPNAKVSVFDDDINQITWLEGTPEIPKADIEAKVVEVKADFDAQEYARLRKKEYPTIEEAVHAILDDTLDELQILRQAVKEKYPK